MLIASSSKAGVWVTAPVLGLAGDYSTNPGLLFVPHTAETHGDILIDTPTTFHANSFSLSMQPSLRISNSSGYSSLSSDYEHLTIAGELDAERNTLTLTSQVARDSSLYYEFGFNGSTGVRRDTLLGDLNWVRALTEKMNFAFDVNASRLNYGRSDSFLVLTDYRYTSASPSLSWNTSERTTFTVLGNVGLYKSSDGATKSVNSNLQLGTTRQLTELWTINAKAGISRETDTLDEYFGPYLLGVLKSANNGTVFSATIARQGPRLNVNAVASRSLVPSGYAFLSRQDSYQAGFQYVLSERWNISGHAQRLSSSEPQALGQPVDQTFWNLGLSAAWLFTEKWTLTLAASKVSVTYTRTTDAASSGLNIQFSRRFDPITWQ